MAQFTLHFFNAKVVQIKVAKHLGASVFELEEFLSDGRTTVTSLPAYWQPKPKPQNKPLQLLELKLPHYKIKEKEAICTN